MSPWEADQKWCWASRSYLRVRICGSDSKLNCSVFHKYWWVFDFLSVCESSMYSANWIWPHESVQQHRAAQPSFEQRMSLHTAGSSAARNEMEREPDKGGEGCLCVDGKDIRSFYSSPRKEKAPSPLPQAPSSLSIMTKQHFKQGRGLVLQALLFVHHSSLSFEARSEASWPKRLTRFKIKSPHLLNPKERRVSEIK